MTLEQCLLLAREIRGLERMEAILTQSGLQEPEWAYVVSAMRDRLAWDRFLRSQEPPELMVTAEELVSAEILHAPSREPSTPSPLIALEVPPSARIH